MPAGRNSRCRFFIHHDLYVIEITSVFLRTSPKATPETTFAPEKGCQMRSGRVRLSRQGRATMAEPTLSVHPFSCPRCKTRGEVRSREASPEARIVMALGICVEGLDGGDRLYCAKIGPECRKADRAAHGMR